MGQVLVVRHAIAEPRDQAPDGRDRTRRVSDRGERVMRRAALGLRRVVEHLPLVAHSPLTRAVQTAAILDAAFPETTARRELAALAPGGDPAAVFRWLAEVSEYPVALVGHEPDLGYWVGQALTGTPVSFLAFRKASICLLEFPDGPAPGAGRLTGHFPPEVLGDLSEVAE
ncbi:SixA phosphatase family protein [Halorhodospira halophila]|uniref:Phosphohistidine phosphatase, SixA n=1 Tax=Halorhodospira halophila (strain DSM 244 / SL1) TaxID=349124 RepID=A1WTJ8_HALHL|nr:histidine phosphatase family protein [Halorhodospira halophila]ABM61010.1 phosphohistidine phosphatase, SixA [Halorhodospira halophila SL1]MBK1729981.1 hypothetical protein [Halorhodospira halophila]